MIQGLVEQEHSRQHNVPWQRRVFLVPWMPIKRGGCRIPIPSRCHFFVETCFTVRLMVLLLLLVVLSCSPVHTVLYTTTLLYRAQPSKTVSTHNKTLRAVPWWWEERWTTSSCASRRWLDADGPPTNTGTGNVTLYGAWVFFQKFQRSRFVLMDLDGTSTYHSFIGGFWSCGNKVSTTESN